MNYERLEIKRGKKPSADLKGIKRQEWIAKQSWYLEYFFSDKSLNKIKQRIRVSHDINEAKTYQQKEERAQIYLARLKKMLDKGFNPLNSSENAKFLNQAISLPLSEAIDLYKNELKELGNRKKTISTYSSKLNYLNKFYPHYNIKAINTSEVEVFLKTMYQKHNWTPQTYNAAKNILVIFFNFMLKKHYIEVNPVMGITKKKVGEIAETHVPMEDEDFALLRSHLKETDEFTYMFVSAIYYTCIRPKELRSMTRGMINLRTNQITIPGTISKNGKSLPVDILDKFKALLNNYDIINKPNDLFMFSSNPDLFGTKPIGENTPYYRFISHLKKLQLDNKGYTLYSVKHLANIHRYQDGWSIQAIMKANRHSSISQTENYLRQIGLKVDVTELITR